MKEKVKIDIQVDDSLSDNVFVLKTKKEWEDNKRRKAILKSLLEHAEKLDW